MIPMMPAVIISFFIFFLSICFETITKVSIDVSDIMVRYNEYAATDRPRSCVTGSMNAPVAETIPLYTKPVTTAAVSTIHHP